MTTDEKILNPFHAWAESARGLYGRIVEEQGGHGKKISPVAADVMGHIAAMVRYSDELGKALVRLRQQDPPAFDAVLRAMEKS